MLQWLWNFVCWNHHGHKRRFCKWHVLASFGIRYLCYQKINKNLPNPKVWKPFSKPLFQIFLSWHATMWYMPHCHLHNAIKKILNKKPTTNYCRSPRLNTLAAIVAKIYKAHQAWKESAEGERWSALMDIIKFMESIGEKKILS